MWFVSLVLGKSILKILRLMGRSGSALPGLVIEKLQPAFLKTMLDTLSEGVIVISGTNGKTTTTKVTTDLLRAQGLRVLTNKTGSNYVRGTITAVIDKASWSGKLPYDIAVFEQDEAHAVHFVRQIAPRGVVVLNLMRDQMDRYGEIDTTAKLLQKVVGAATSWVVLNANDGRIAKLRPAKGVDTYWFGHNKNIQDSFVTDDELHNRGDTSYSTAAEMVAELMDFNNQSVDIRLNNQLHHLKTSLSSSHNAINLTAACATLIATIPKFDIGVLKGTVKTLQPAFGRGEVISLPGGEQITLQLVKNPGGFRHSLGMIDHSVYQVVGIAINDDYADGRDVSWLWDVDFSRFQKLPVSIICGGTRGYDMAVRLKYDNIITDNTELNLSSLVSTVNAAADKKQAIIFCTYTAMLKIRAEYGKYSSDIKQVSV